MSLARLAAATLLLLAGLTPLHAQARRVYLRAAAEEDLERIAELNDALQLAPSERDATRAATLVSELLAGASSPKSRDSLVAVSDRHHRGLRAHLVDWIPKLPDDVLAKVREFQQRAAKQALRGEAPPSTPELLRRFPASEIGADAVERLWQRALEEDDRAQSRALSALLGRLHPARLDTEAAKARLALMAARPAPAPRPRKPLASRLVSVATATLRERPDARTPEAHSPSFPLAVDDRVCVSNGAVLKIFDLRGGLLHAIPSHPTAASEAPPESSRFQARLAEWGGAVYCPLVLERWLTPARLRSEADGSLASRFYTLLALDPQRGRILWWDGDGGPSTPPPRTGRAAAPGDPPPRPTSPAPGLGLVSPALNHDLAMGHVIAVATDSARVYTAVTIKGDEPQLAIMAYRRDTGSQQPLVLRPAWSLTTHVLAAERAEGSAEDQPVAAEIAASLALDGRGRLVCTTDLGVATCLDTRSGELQWTHQVKADTRQAGNFRARRTRMNLSHQAPPSPARFLTKRDGTRLVVLFAGSRLLGLDLRDGSLSWELEADGQGPNGPRLPQQRATRLTWVNGVLAAYGGSMLFTVSEAGARLQTTRTPGRNQGEGLVLDDRHLLLPLRMGAAIELRRFRIGGVRGEASPVLARIQNRGEPLNLAATPEGVVAASRYQVVFLRWQ